MGVTVAGRHAARCTWLTGSVARLLRPAVPLLGAVLAASVLGGGAAMFAISASPHQRTGVVTAAPVSVVAPAATASRAGDDRASRGGTRTGTATVTPAPTRSPATGSGTCAASYYSDGQVTANGELFDPAALTAAHKSLPFNSRVRVTNPGNGKSVVVRINDRGPYVSGRCLDLSEAAFKAIASLSAGVVTVRYDVLG